MRSRPILALALAGTCAALAASPAAAQQAIRAGQTVSGRLDNSDPTLDDGSHYEIWSYRGRAGERVTITLRSSDFDAYLAFGRMSGGECEGGCDTDDDGAGGTDARLEVTVGDQGSYVIRANTLSAGETGSYTLQVEAGGSGGDDGDGGGGESEEIDLSSAREIRPGAPVSGELDGDDPRLGDDSYYELYTFTGRAGERVTITMRSEDFDTFLALGREVGGRFEPVESNDDGDGEGTNSRIEVTLPANGRYVIRANSLAGSATGAYTLEMRSAR